MQFIDIKHSLCSARISLKGGQLLSWKPCHGIKDVLWCTPSYFFQEDQPIRGGIPICWPWFGKVKIPAHGFARNMIWTQQSIKETAEGVEVILNLSDNHYSRQLWPHSFLLTLRFNLGKHCKVELMIDCEADTYGALHSYFNVDDIEKVEIEGTGQDSIDSNTGIKANQSKNLLAAPINIDRIYTKPSPTTQLFDLKSGRTIYLSHINIQDLVIWNPGSEAAKKLIDLEANAFQSFVCIETASINKPLQSSIGVTIELN